jgi:hypothetical protein
MNQYIKLVIMVACAIMFGVQCLAAASLPMDMKFLSSRAAIRAYALESARQAQLDLSSAGFAQGSIGFGTSWTKPMSSEELREQLNGWDYDIPMVNVVDDINVDAQILSGDFDPLFIAYRTTIRAELGKGGYYVHPFVSMRMADEIPFRLDKSIRQVRVSYVGADGKTIYTVNLRSDGDGKFFIDPNLAGAGYMELIDNDWNMFVYDLRNGGVKTSIELVRFTGAQMWIDGVVSYTNPVEVDFTVWTWRGIGQNPTIEVIMSSPGKCSVTVATRDGALPVGFYVRLQSDVSGIWNYIVRPTDIKGPALFFDEGVNYVIPVWNPEDLREEPPVMGTPVCCGGGKY